MSPKERSQEARLPQRLCLLRHLFGALFCVFTLLLKKAYKFLGSKLKTVYSYSYLFERHCFHWTLF